jgi:putative membrane protein
MRSSPTCWRSSRRSFVLVCAFGLAALPVAAAAQMGNPGFMAPDTRTDENGMPAPDQKNAADILFVQLVGAGGLAEVSLGELALEKGAASAVTEFAERMVADHGAANDELAALAEGQGIAVPTDLDAEHAAMRDYLGGLDAGVFDLHYMRGQVVDHQKTAQLLEWEINSGQNAPLQRFAAETLPTVLEHLSMARGIVEDLAREQFAATPPAPRASE